jgi:tRNA A37 threonylcarbamoyladenosine synthetase subunit TsaC/SUA5/YrdC
MASRSEKPHFVVMLTTAGGETAAYRSPDKDFIERVLGALTEAIISRG